jgi:putative DNA primase/helicase
MQDNTNITNNLINSDQIGSNSNSINPTFDLSKFDPIGIEDIHTEAEKLLRNKDATPHTEILNELVKQLEPLDFEALANPHDAENFSLADKHILVLTIENTLQFAEKNRWGLCKNHDFIYLYNGTFWAEIDKETCIKFLGESAEQMGVPKFSARYYQFKENLYKQFLSTAYLPIPKSKMDMVTINLQNGTFEISPEGTRLRSFDRSDFITYQLPFNFESQAESPIFNAYLNRVLPDKDCQKVLAEYVGYVFLKHGSNTLKEEKALVLYATGANGKSVFFEIVNALLGIDNVSNFSLQSLTNDNGYYRAKLANKLVNYASEINGNLEASIFKQLVSGEPVEARLPYGQPFILKQYAKLIFNCNELPKGVEHTNAYFRRFLIIPFDVTIPAHEQDKQLHLKIIEKELSGVFNWALEGLNRLLDQKRFSDCEAAKRAIEQYRVESDSVQMFLVEHDYRVSTINEIPLKDMYNDYRNYCIEGGFKPCSRQKFSERLRSSGYTSVRKNYGMAVNAENNDYL